MATRDWHAPLPTPTTVTSRRAEPDYDHLARALRRRLPGAEYHPDLQLPAGRCTSARAGAPGLLGFEGEVVGCPEPLADVLTAAGVTDVDVVGLATDHCVAATATDARAAGFARPSCSTSRPPWRCRPPCGVARLSQQGVALTTSDARLSA